MVTALYASTWAGRGDDEDTGEGTATVYYNVQRVSGTSGTKREAEAPQTGSGLHLKSTFSSSWASSAACSGEKSSGQRWRAHPGCPGLNTHQFSLGFLYSHLSKRRILEPKYENQSNSEIDAMVVMTSPGVRLLPPVVEQVSRLTGLRSM